MSIAAILARSTLPEWLRQRRQAMLAMGFLHPRRAHGAMPWVIAILTALTIVAAAAALALGNLTARASDELAGGVTVQILASDPDLRIEEREAAVRVLLADPAVQSVRAVPRQELEAQLEPWLGAIDDAGAIPIPELIELRLRSDAGKAEISRLAAALAPVAPSANLAAQADWLEPVFSAIEALRFLAAALILMLAGASVGAVWLAARSAFASHHDTVEIIHLLGGTDQQIVRGFQRVIAGDALFGAIAGSMLGTAAVLFIGNRFAALDSGMSANAGLSLADWLILVMIPIAAVAVAMLTARLTLMRALRRMP